VCPTQKGALTVAVVKNGKTLKLVNACLLIALATIACAFSDRYAVACNLLMCQAIKWIAPITTTQILKRASVRKCARWVVAAGASSTQQLASVCLMTGATSRVMKVLSLTQSRLHALPIRIHASSIQTHASLT